ncbi:COG4223 family protein [Hansschlegelia beijingensis]|uniref:Phage tail protein n=1 Tax=Hansschlegelia beijingensis TaxID=1133344 RepID=A0A7W6GHK0_9HYPH|nr:hypothetical protein [Hansschlegelia beijingensis]MBB3973864.1 hypothetical protein [Hansschlegelia beijingensis]
MATIALFGRDLIPAVQPDDARVAAAESKLDALGGEVAALRDRAGQSAPPAGDAGATDERLAEVGKTIEATNARAEALEKQVAELTAKVESSPQGGDQSAVAALASRLEAVEQRGSAVDAVAGLDKRVTDLDGRISDLDGRVAALGGRLDKLATAEQLEALTAKVPETVAEAVKPLDGRVASVEGALKARPAGDPAARSVVALGALEQALDAGRPFAAELEAVKTSTSNGELTALDAFAASGVPTRQALAKELSGIMAQLPAEKPAESASLFDKFVASAGSVVKVTPKDAGSATENPRARVAALAAAGDVEQALAARQGLDQEAQAATAGWAEKATARIAAEKAVEGARAAALARLSATE